MIRPHACLSISQGTLMISLSVPLEFNARMDTSWSSAVWSCVLRWYKTTPRVCEYVYFRHGNRILCRMLWCTGEEVTREDSKLRNENFIICSLHHILIGRSNQGGKKDNTNKILDAKHFMRGFIWLALSCVIYYQLGVEWDTFQKY
jgi:hypothetical protein